MPGVTGVTHATDAPTIINNGTTGVLWEGKDPNSKIDFTQVGVGYDFIKNNAYTNAAGQGFFKGFCNRFC
jgi:hypothetical protein